jgi:ABC-type cobalamin/Fe3+-siderophores transport system ATPase subunit
MSSSEFDEDSNADIIMLDEPHQFLDEDEEVE